MPPEVSRVLVTGASGFIASHVIHQLLDAGHTVRGTVRSLQDEDKVKAIKNIHPASNERLELVEADLNDENCWDAAVAGCSHVLHIASPFPRSNPWNEDKVIGPAVQGVRLVMKASIDSGTVKRVVYTSSAYAIASFKGGKFNENDWSDTSDSSQTAYSKSKHFAEKAAWATLETQGGSELELVVLNPVGVFGPGLAPTLSTTQVYVQEMMKNWWPLVPRFSIPVIDVRDVATAHVRAMTADGVVGKRIIISNGCMFFKDMIQVLQEEYNPMGYNIKSHTCPDFLTKTLSVVMTDLKPLIPGLGKVNEFDNTRMRELLDIQPIGHRKMLVDMGHSLISMGLVPKKAGYKPQGE